MADFIIAALPWVILGITLAICIAFIAVKKAKSKTSDTKDKNIVARQEKHKMPDDEILSDKQDVKQDIKQDIEQDNSQDEKQNENYNYMSLGLLFGLCGGFLAGSLIPGLSQSIGMCLGMPVGLMLGSFIKKK